jgi:hypothetical protein
VLQSKDYKCVLAFAERLYAQRDTAAFPQFLLRELPQLVGADHVRWNDIALTVPRATVIEAPRLPGWERRGEVLSRYLFDHPGLCFRLRTGYRLPLKLSDVVSARQLHRLPIYQALFRPMGCEDLFSVNLSGLEPRMQAVTLGRDQRSFTERDRALLTLIQSHLAQAHRNVQALTRAKRVLNNSDMGYATPGVCIIEVDTQGRAREYAPHVHGWWARYFANARPLGVHSLPDSLQAWMRRTALSPAGAPRPTFVRRHGGRQLTVRYFLGFEGTVTLLLEECSLRDASRSSSAASLACKSIASLAASRPECR